MFDNTHATLKCKIMACVVLPEMCSVFVLGYYLSGCSPICFVPISMELGFLCFAVHSDWFGNIMHFTNLSDLLYF